MDHETGCIFFPSEGSPSCTPNLFKGAPEALCCLAQGEKSWRIELHSIAISGHERSRSV